MPNKHHRPPPYVPPPVIPPAFIPFSYEPVVAVVVWKDANGTFSGDLAHFTQFAQKSTVYDIEIRNQGLTKLTIGNLLAKLKKFAVRFSPLLAVAPDASACPFLEQYLVTYCGVAEFPAAFIPPSVMRFSHDGCPVTKQPVLAALPNLLSYDGSGAQFTGLLDTSKNLPLTDCRCYNMPGLYFNFLHNGKITNVDGGSNQMTADRIDQILRDMDTTEIRGQTIQLFGNKYPTLPPEFIEQLRVKCLNKEGTLPTDLHGDLQLGF